MSLWHKEVYFTSQLFGLNSKSMMVHVCFCLYDASKSYSSVSQEDNFLLLPICSVQIKVGNMKHSEG